MPIIISPSFLIQPISDLTHAIAMAGYDKVDPFIIESTIPLAPVHDAKNVAVACFDTFLTLENIRELLAAQLLCLCSNGPLYLLGLMAQTPEAVLPNILVDRSIVAAEPDNPASIFGDGRGNQCFLYVGRRGGRRGLFLVDKDKKAWGFAYGFLVERM